MSEHIGLQVLYTPERKSALADLVFVHGLGGHRRKTWTRKKPLLPSDTPSLLGRLLPGRKRKAVAIDGESEIQAPSQPDNGGSEVFWPEDLLPKDLPTCRICTWGYNVDLNLVRTDTSTATVYQHAKNLLSDVADARMSKEERSRPLIFIAHSLGGIVVKDALNISYKERSYLNEILVATQGICFLGTPHRGSSKAALAETLSRVTETWGNSPNMQILQALKYDAETLDRIQSDFLLVHSEHRMKIRTFQEGLDYKGLIIVDRFSSRIDIQGEMPVDIEANHVDMVKYSSVKDNGYIRVSKTLLRWVNELQEQAVEDSASLKDIMADCLQSLENTKRGGRSQQVEHAFRGTLDWLFSDQVSFKSWLHDSQLAANPLYWISGKPGSGKSTIMKYALEHEKTMELLRRASPGRWSILSFFFHDRGSDIQKSIHGLIEELVYQLLFTNASLIPLICYIRIRSLIDISGRARKPGAPMFDGNTKWTRDEIEAAKRIIKSALPEELRSAWSLSQLEEAFNILINQSIVPLNVCLFIDALDEHSGDHERLLTMIRSLKRNRTKDTAFMKICVSSRLEPSFIIAFASCPQFKVHHHTVRDIEVYAQGCLESNAGASVTQLDRVQLRGLATEVTQKADGVFIWVRLVVKELVEEFVNGSSVTLLSQLLNTLPKELEDLYRRILDKLKQSYRVEFYLMCKIMLTAITPLSLRMLILAIDVNISGDCSDWSIGSMVRRLSSRSGGLIEITGRPHDEIVKDSDDVQFIHKTFKDFIRSPDNILYTSGTPAVDIYEVGCKSLLKASGYVLKYLTTYERSLYKGLYQFNFYYAAGLQKYSHAADSNMVSLLDVLLDPRELDISEPGITGLQLWRVETTDLVLSIKEEKTFGQHSPRSLEYDLATIAANYGVLEYVRRKVHDGLSIEYPKRCALLWSVVAGLIKSRVGRFDFVPHVLRCKLDDYIRLLTYLVDRGAHVGNTWSHMDELQLLLNEGISSTTDLPDTLKMMEWLLKNGANPNRKTRTNRLKGYSDGTALWLLLDREIWLYEVWKLLLQYGADPNRKMGHNYCLLYFAILKNKPQIAKLLCRAGADPTKVGQGINCLRLDQFTLDQFDYSEDTMRLFVKNTIQMQSMLRKFSNGPKSSTVDAGNESSNPTTHETNVQIEAITLDSENTEKSSGSWEDDAEDTSSESKEEADERKMTNRAA